MYEGDIEHVFLLYPIWGKAPTEQTDPSRSKAEFAPRILPFVGHGKHVRHDDQHIARYRPQVKGGPIDFALDMTTHTKDVALTVYHMDKGQITMKG
jgi:hypothetical protein